MARAFISYSHQDESYRAELDKHLALLKRQGHIEIWSDHCIRPGEAFDPAISTALDSADLVLLLVSADFIHSDYCYSVEVQRALERHQAGSAIVVPIIIRPCDWMSAPFGRIKALPTDAKPVTRWPSLDDAFLDIVQQLRTLLTKSPAKPASAQPERRPSNATESPAANQGSAHQRLSRSSNLSLPRTFSDEQRHDFIAQSFDYIRNYFDKSLEELRVRNPGISVRMNVLSARSFSAIIFRDGKRVAGCHIRLGGGFSSDGIAYSASENASENSFNELLSVETDQHLLYLKATMGMFHGNRDSRLTDEGAAEHLWTMFISPIQR